MPKITSNQKGNLPRDFNLWLIIRKKLFFFRNLSEESKLHIKWMTNTLILTRLGFSITQYMLIGLIVCGLLCFYTFTLFFIHNTTHTHSHTFLPRHQSLCTSHQNSHAPLDQGVWIPHPKEHPHDFVSVRGQRQESVHRESLLVKPIIRNINPQ